MSFETTRCHLSDCLIGLGVIIVVIAAVVHVTGGEVIIQNRHVEPNAFDASLHEFITYSCTTGDAGTFHNNRDIKCTCPYDKS